MAPRNNKKRLATKKNPYYEAVGRRKESVCRIRLYVADDKELTVQGVARKKGDMIVNAVSIESYFPGRVLKMMYSRPYEVTGSLGRFAVIAKNIGGGTRGQAEAFSLASARALLKVDPVYRDALKDAGLLKVDARTRERRKVGMGGKARRARQSPKR